MSWSPLPVPPPAPDTLVQPSAQTLWRRLWTILAPHDQPRRVWAERTRHDLAPPDSSRA